jgi:nucleoside-diphosphate-sugar epimerase
MHLAITGGRTIEESITNSEKAIDALMFAAKENGIKHIVNMSSVVVHGETVPEDLTADSPLISYGDAYAAGKLAAENRFWKLLDEYQLHGSVIRPTYVWGPYSMWYTIHILKQMKKGDFAWVENGNGMCNAVYVGNVVDMCIKCCSEPAADHQAFIATDGEQLTWREFYGQYMQMIGKRPEDYLSVPLQPSAMRRMRLALRDCLEKNMKTLMDKYETLKPTSPRLALWVYKAPRKVLRHLRNLVMWHIAEKGAVEMAIYSQATPINVDKNEELLNFVPRYSVAKGMELTKEWLKQTDLYD